jgi:hypothetical protein
MFLKARNYVYLRQDGGAGGGSQAGPIVPLDQSQAAAAVAAAAQETERLKQENKTLKDQTAAQDKRLKDLEGTIVSPEYLEFLGTKAKGGKGSGTDDKGKDSKKDDKIDFEALTNAQLAGVIVEQVVGQVKTLIQPLAGRQEATDTRLQVAEAAKLYPDFWEYKDAMIELSTRRPDLSPADVYVMVKGAEIASGRSLRKPVAKSGTADETGAENRGGGRTPVSTELGTGPGGGEHREVPSKTYAEEAGKIFDKIFKK